MLNPYKAYQETEINTASKGRLVVMLYGGAQKFITEAKLAINDNRIESAHNAITRANDIITELRCDLDMEIGGELAVNLDNLYEYIEYKLMAANIKKSIQELDEALTVISDLKEAWVAITSAARASQGAATAIQATRPAIGL